MRSIVAVTYHDQNEDVLKKRLVKSTNKLANIYENVHDR